MSEQIAPTKEELLAAFRAGKLPRASQWQFLIERLFDTFQGNVDLINKHGEVVAFYESIIAIKTAMEEHLAVINTKHSDIDLDQQQVASDRQDVETRQADIVQRQTDINAAADAHLASLQSESDTQVARVQSEGNTFIATVTQEKNEAIAAKTTAVDARDDALLIASTMAGGIVEMGNWDASGGVLPAKPEQNSGFWKITGEGVLNGIDLGIGDSLVYSKTTDSFYKIDNTESVTSVQGKKGIVTLIPEDIGAEPALPDNRKRALHASTSEPAPEDWEPGDFWFIHE